MSAVRIPRRFYEDHLWRDLPTPIALRETKRHVWIDSEDEAVIDLLSDAEHHAEEAMHFDPPMPGLASSARATVRALAGVIR